MRAPDGPWALMMRITTRVHHQQRPLKVSNEPVRCDRATVESQGLKDESHGRTVDHIVCDHKVERRAHPVRQVARTSRIGDLGGRLDIYGSRARSFRLRPRY